MKLKVTTTGVDCLSSSEFEAYKEIGFKFTEDSTPDNFIITHEPIIDLCSIEELIFLCIKHRNIIVSFGDVLIEYNPHIINHDSYEEHLCKIDEYKATKQDKDKKINNLNK